MDLLVSLLIIFYLSALFIQLFLLKFRNFHLLSKEKVAINNKKQPSISIVICAKNEAENLKLNLPFALQQEYPDNHWEVIVVDDDSDDNSQNILNEFRKEYRHLKFISSKSTSLELPGKKKALHAGISSALYDLILLTDADCIPSSKQWLQHFANTYAIKQKPIVLGYGAYQYQKGLLNKIIQWETLQTFIQYAGMSLQGLPYMGVGRNIMYEKQLYHKALNNENFTKIYTATASGDDDLLISHIANAENTAICYLLESHTISKPENNFKDWLNQKRRHQSTGKFYSPKIKNILGIQALSLGLFWMGFIIIGFVLLFNLIGGSFSFEKSFYNILLFSFSLGLIRIILYLYNSRKWYQLLKTKQSILFYPFGEIFISLLYLINSPYVFWKNKSKWK